MAPLPAGFHRAVVFGHHENPQALAVAHPRSQEHHHSGGYRGKAVHQSVAVARAHGRYREVPHAGAGRGRGVHRAVAVALAHRRSREIPRAGAECGKVVHRAGAVAPAHPRPRMPHHLSKADALALRLSQVARIAWDLPEYVVQLNVELARAPPRTWQA